MIDHVARQLGIAEVGCLSNYLEREPTRHAHRAEIRAHYGYRDFGEPPWSFRLSRWLFLRAWLSEERPSLLFDLATAWLIERKVLLPGVTTLTRLVARIRERSASRLWRRLCALPSAAQQEQLEALVAGPPGNPLQSPRPAATRPYARQCAGLDRRAASASRIAPVENQASDRSHRIGQKNKVIVTRLLMRHTVEEKMMALKQRKLSLYRALMDTPEKSAGKAITREDFNFLLGLN